MHCLLSCVPVILISALRECDNLSIGSNKRQKTITSMKSCKHAIVNTNMQLCVQTFTRIIGKHACWWRLRLRCCQMNKQSVYFENKLKSSIIIQYHFVYIIYYYNRRFSVNDCSKEKVTKERDWTCFYLAIICIPYNQKSILNIKMLPSFINAIENLFAHLLNMILL